MPGGIRGKIAGGLIGSKGPSVKTDASNIKPAGATSKLGSARQSRSELVNAKAETFKVDNLKFSSPGISPGQIAHLKSNDELI